MGWALKTKINFDGFYQSPVLKDLQSAGGPHMWASRERRSTRGSGEAPPLSSGTSMSQSRIPMHLQYLTDFPWREIGSVTNPPLPRCGGMRRKTACHDSELLLRVHTARPVPYAPTKPGGLYCTQSTWRVVSGGPAHQNGRVEEGGAHRG